MVVEYLGDALHVLFLDGIDVFVFVFVVDVIVL